jgi:hypothetical protein
MPKSYRKHDERASALTKVHLIIVTTILIDAPILTLALGLRASS